MNASEQPSDHGVSRTAGGCILSLMAPLLLVAQIVFSLVTYPLLPDIVPSHYNAAGQVNGTMPKLGFVLLFVGISLGIFILLQVIRTLTKLDNDERKRQLASLIISCITAFILVIELIAQVVITGGVLHWW